MVLIHQIRAWISFLLRLLKGTGVFVVTRTADTNTSSSLLTVVVSLTCAKEIEKKKIEKKENKNVLKVEHFCSCEALQLRAFATLKLKIVFIRKKITNKRGNYSFC